MMNERRREEMAKRIALMARFGSIAGATVLEIGADADSFAARMLVDAGASKVISSNFRERWPTDTVGAIERRRIDARRLEDSLEPESVDIIFGAAVLEHIDGLAQFFAGAKRTLKKNGLFFVHGGPIWSSAKGHHVFVKGETVHYRFGDKNTNPIQDWTHLALDKPGLIADLRTRGVPPGDAATIGTWVYEEDGINRVGYRAICETFQASGLALLEQMDNAFKPPPPDLREVIERGPWAGQERYDVSGITFAARP